MPLTIYHGNFLADHQTKDKLSQTQRLSQKRSGHHCLSPLLALVVGQEDDLSNNLKSLGMKTVMISFKVLSEIFLQGALKVMLVSY